ncbi:hypothetical protein BDB00DRAFT_838793 [Zychaea mexicana]|uniref:uncharacterized protein n=1 Tax=Zychaea mexicana TaxID=64656 RepID=UPI0022FEABB8|nr:uncharacterized protein BDB00DRAFT_838793 [Zychaea mexicana]KAI9490215.1 hypothetical protein BDB00DRAFT_838793 [Zychaea mexicana]
MLTVSVLLCSLLDVHILDSSLRYLHILPPKASLLGLLQVFLKQCLDAHKKSEQDDQKRII